MEKTWEGECNLVEVIRYLGTKQFGRSQHGHAISRTINMKKLLWCWLNDRSKPQVTHHVATWPKMKVQVTIPLMVDYYEWWQTWQRAQNCFAWGLLMTSFSMGSLGVVNHGYHIICYIIEKDFQVGNANGLD